MEIKEAVLKTLKESKNPLKGGEIAEVLEIDKKEVDKVIKLLKTEGRICSPKRCYYSVQE